jgi:hypothetical protein
MEKENNINDILEKVKGTLLALNNTIIKYRQRAYLQCQKNVWKLDYNNYQSDYFLQNDNPEFCN